MSTGGRFSRGKSRLVQREQKIHDEKVVLKRLGKTIPEEVVKIPKIGEWSLNPNQPIVSISEKKNIALNEKNSVPFNEAKKTFDSYQIRNASQSFPEKNIPIYKFSPHDFSHPHKNAPEQRKDYPEGTTTTNIPDILRSKYRVPNKPLPPLVDFNSIENPKFLPLEYFDNEEYGEFSIEELMKDPQAMSQYSEIGGQSIWESCQVLSYDESTKTFDIIWDFNGKTKRVSRFNLRFNRENPERFMQRVQAAKQQCMLYEISLRYDARIALMTIDDVPTLPQSSLNNIENRIGKYKSLSVVSVLEKEIESEYISINNRLEFDYEILHNPVIPNREEFLFFKNATHTPNSNYIDFIRIPSFDITKYNVINSHLFNEPIILQGFYSIWELLQSFRNKCFLLNNFEKTVTLEDFITLQYSHLGESANQIRSSISNHLNSTISKLSTSHEKNGSKVSQGIINRIILLSQKMMHSILIDITNNTLGSYFEMFNRFLNKDDEGLFFIDVFFQEPNSLEFLPTTDVFLDQLISLLSQFETVISDLPTISGNGNSNSIKLHITDCVEMAQNKKKLLTEVLDQLFERLQWFISEFKFLEHYLRLDPEEFALDFDPMFQKPLSDYHSQLSDFDRVLGILNNDMKPFYNIGMFKLMCRGFQETCKFHIEQMRYMFLSQISKHAVHAVRDLRSDFDIISLELRRQPETPEMLDSIKKYIDNIISTSKQRNEMLSNIISKFEFLEQYRYEISDEDFQQRYEAMKMPTKISQRIEETERILSVERIRMIRDLRSNQRKLENETLSVSEVVNSLMGKYTDLEITSEAVEQVNLIGNKLQVLKNQQELFNEHEKLFEFEPVACRILTKLVEEFTPLHVLWNTAHDWVSSTSQWYDTPFPHIKVENMSTFINSSLKKMNQVKKEMSGQRLLMEKVISPLLSQIESIKQRMPLLIKLRHPGIKKKHWEQISDIVGFPVYPSVETSLQLFLETKLERWNDMISEIASIAAQEYNIEYSIDSMDNELHSMQFYTVQYKDSGHFILQRIDIITGIVDDQIVATESLLSSPFITPVKSQAVERLSFLKKARKIIESWVTCQKKWLSLHPLLSTQSIQQNLISETSVWQSANKIWSTTMTLTHNHPDFLSVLQRESLPINISQCSEMLETISRGLTKYLEQKRISFPRFFFLSNDELSRILSSNKDKVIIEESMPKLFMYLKRIEISSNNEITHISDSYGEKIKLHAPISVDVVDVENWLSAFDDEIRVTIKDSIRQSLAAFAINRRIQWLFDYPCQVGFVSNKVLWTQQVVSSLKSRKMRGIQALKAKQIELITQLSDSIQTTKDEKSRAFIASMLIQDVHHREILSQMIKNDVSDPESFEWLKQIRYFWEEDSVLIRCINNSFEYLYEFCGNSPRLVVTPLTDRCYQTILSSFRFFNGCQLSGPSSTGKTETIKDCAKALGRPCFVFNCFEEVTSEQMSHFIAGVASVGTWACFDEFNRITIDVLSVISQQVRLLYSSLVSLSEIFSIDGRLIPLNPHGGICITLNLGYINRNALPDNLKVLFRPVAMVNPAFAMITEVLLFSNGFSQASHLSLKLSTLFDLCSKQLSNTKHYDWSLSFMRAIVTTAVRLHKDDTSNNEFLVFLNAIRKSIEPYLTSEDSLIFNNILKDVFPNESYFEQISEIQESVKETFSELDMKPDRINIRKVVQLYETMQVRHGIMLIGSTFSGKSTSLNVLRSTLMKNSSIICQTINPKALSISELFGLYNASTSEWSDGVFSRHLRDYSTLNSTSWIVLDGPVDSLWVESMNTLLDENKVLCLSNNERIHISPRLRILFEVDDLSAVSPATITRCGMIFYDPHEISWKAIIENWCNLLSKKDVELSNVLKSLMEKYIPSILQFMANDVKMEYNILPNVALNNFLSLLSCYVVLSEKPDRYSDNNDQTPLPLLDPSLYFSRFAGSSHDKIPYIDSEQYEVVYERIFLFCVVWGFGGYLPDENRLLFDRFLKDQCDAYGCHSVFPSRYTVFDYYADLTKFSWVLWSDSMTEMSFSTSQDLENHVIPTNEYASALFLSRILICNNRSIHFSGPESFKTLLISSLKAFYLNKVPYVSQSQSISKCSTPKSIIQFISQLLHKRQGKYGPLTSQKLVLMFDDISSIDTENNGSQPVIEMIRHLIGFNGWFNPLTTEFCEVVDTSYIISSGFSSSSKFSISKRLFRHFFFTHIPKVKIQSTTQIFTHLVSQRLSKFSQSVKDIMKPTVNATLDILEQCVSNLHPIPAKSHYVFGLKNITRVLKGILLINPQLIQTDSQFIRLWFHEMLREFHDRLNSNEDRRWFLSVLTEMLPKYYKVQWNTINTSDFVMFNEFADGSQLYKEVTVKPDQLLSTCVTALKEHNRDATKTIDMTLSHESVEHVSALSRVLSMNRGHAMLIGPKAIGRRSLSRLTLHIDNVDEFTICITKKYGLLDWKEDMKKLIRKCGARDEQTAFLVSDTQILFLKQLEDIRNLITRGEIPHLFDQSETEALKTELVASAVQLDIDYSSILLERIRKNLHILFVISPYSNVFRDIVLSFPAILSESTIDWFMPWSQAALESIAQESLGNGHIGSPDVVHSVVSVCVSIHKSVDDFASRFFVETGRNVSITPRCFHNLLKLLLEKLMKKQRETAESARDYENAVEKIVKTRTQIQEMSLQLDHDIPVLEKTQSDAEIMVKELHRRKKDAEETRAIVVEQSLIAENEAKESEAANQIAQEQLRLAQPLLMEAQEAVNRLDKDSLVSIKKLHIPSSGMKETFEAVCIMFGRAPRKVDTPTPGVKEDDYWPEAVSLLNDVQFIKNITNFSIESMPKDVIHRLKKYVPKDKGIRSEKRKSALASFQAVASLYDWVCASFDYWHVYQEMLPKRKAADAASFKLEESRKELQKSRAHLEEIERNLNYLEETVLMTQKKELQLSKSVKTTQERLERAKKLIDGLSGQTTQWSERAENLRNSAKFILGDSILMASALTYLGAFSATYRLKMIEEWKFYLTKQGIKYSQNFSIVESMVSESSIRSWILMGLPNDHHSIENAVIITENSKSYPLLIDPQQIGIRWLRSYIGERLMVLRFDHPHFLTLLKSSVTKGSWLLIDSIGNELDPVLDTVLSRETVYIDNVLQISIGGENIPFNENFRLFLATDYPNPKYSPEVASMTSIINFSTTKEGLTNLLLNNLIEVERDDLDKKRIQILEANSENLRKLKEIEDEILRVVTGVDGNDILEDDKALLVLSSAQKTSASITQQMAISEKTEQQILAYKKRFVSVAERATLLYFCISELSNIDPMYYFSLKWFVSLFRTSISKADHPSDPLMLVGSLQKSITFSIFQEVSVSLFTRHILLFTSLIAIRILESENRISQHEISFMISPHPTKDKSPIRWISDENWGYLCSLSSISPNFRNTFESIQNNDLVWQKYFDLYSVEKEPLPIKDNMSSFTKLLMIRVMRIDRVCSTLEIMISDVLGPDFLSNPIFEISHMFKNTDRWTPIIFITSSGADPFDEIMSYAHSQGIASIIKPQSIGKGQGPSAERLLNHASEQGHIVVFQNCHLSLSITSRIEFLFSGLDPVSTHQKFRLVLITTSIAKFPLGLLFRGKKIIYETPRGIKDNVTHLLSKLGNDEFVSSLEPTIEKQLCFHLAYFHSIVVERNHFGTIGWNSPYEFVQSDFNISYKQLRMFFSGSRSTDIPFSALNYMIGQLNYGGHITDNWDRRTVESIMFHFFSPLVNSKAYQLSSRFTSPNYSENLESIVEHVSKWPHNTNGSDVFLGENAESIQARSSATTLFASLTELMPAIAHSGASANEDSIKIAIVEEILAQIPNQFNISAFKKKFDSDSFDSSMSSFIMHELCHYNVLISVIHSSLAILQSGLKGQIIIDNEQESILKQIVANKVPKEWLEYSYTTAFNLKNYIKDLLKRVMFIDQWIRTGSPAVFRLNAFFNPEEFLTSILQSYSRRHSIPYDSLCYKTIVTTTQNPQHFSAPPAEGIYVEGFSIEGAKWEMAKESLVDCIPGETIASLPVIHLLPSERFARLNDLYECPVFRTNARESIKSIKSNYVFSLHLKTSSRTPEHWIQRSVAAFIQIS